MKITSEKLIGVKSGGRNRNDGYTVSRKKLTGWKMLCKWSKYVIYDDK